MAQLRFRGSHSPLSNFFPVMLRWRGKTYRSSEHAYQHAKLHFLQFEKADCILQTPDGSACKVMANYWVKKEKWDLTEWDKMKTDVMLDILTAKWYQCQPYQNSLSDPREIVEDTTDNFWGRGPTGYGANHLGKLHMDIRGRHKNILIAGSSHARTLKPFMQDACMESGIIASINICSISGGTVERVASAMKAGNLHQFDIIIIVCGGNDLFTKTGERHIEARCVLQSLTDLALSLDSMCTQVLLTPLLPRTVCTMPGRTSLPKAHFVTYKKLAMYVNRHLKSQVDLSELWRCYYNFLCSDGVHLNDAGKVFLTQAWTKCMER